MTPTAPTPTAPTVPAPASGGPPAGPAALRPRTRARGVVRANRLVLALVGLLLAGAGGAALAAGLGVFGGGVADRPVLDGSVSRFAEAHGWYWPVVAVGAGLVALLSLWWLLAQARSDRVSALPLSRDPRRGHTDLDAAALTGAVEDEVEGYRGVARARAVLSGAVTAPALALTVTLDGRAGPGELHPRVVQGAVAHARQALGRPDLPARVEFVLPRRPRRDVR
ncbi:alkaline shock response membrane anchor protein AmaP [Geodermatophilus sp. SYSU D01106]